MAIERVKVVHPSGKVGYVAATYPPLVNGALNVAPSERARRRNQDPPTEPTPALPPADEPSITTPKES